MKTLTNFIPHKHTLFSASLIAASGLVRSHLMKQPRTIDELWIEIKKDKTSLITPDFSQVILSVNLLFAIKQLYLNEWSQLAIINSCEEIKHEID